VALGLVLGPGRAARERGLAPGSARAEPDAGPEAAHACSFALPGHSANARDTPTRRFHCRV